MEEPKVYIESLGCPKNTADSEFMAGLLKFSGCEIVKSPEKADVILINTCGFIEPAKEESIETIFELLELKKDRLKKLVVCGCLYERYKKELKEELPEVDAFLGVNELEKITGVVLGRDVKGSRLYRYRELIEEPHIGYLKISDGCSNGCTFCSIPLIKGGFRSREMDELVDEAIILAEKGVKELYIVAQDTTAYMFEKGENNQLVKLLERLERIDCIEWIRVMYTYPSFITDELIDLISSSKKIVHYLDIPLQHVSDRVLRDMGRLYSRDDIERLLYKLREKIYDIAIRSTFIVGFPSETEENFRELTDFISEFKLDWMGFFKYYHEDGTLSFKRFKDMDNRVKEERVLEIEALASFLSEELNSRYIGKTVEVMIDGESEELEGYFIGRTYRSAIEIDGTVFVEGRNLKKGDIVLVYVEKLLNPFDLMGKVVQKTKQEGR